MSFEDSPDVLTEPFEVDSLDYARDRRLRELFTRSTLLSFLREEENICVEHMHNIIAWCVQSSRSRESIDVFSIAQELGYDVWDPIQGGIIDAAYQWLNASY